MKALLTAGVLLSLVLTPNVLAKTQEPSMMSFEQREETRVKGQEKVEATKTQNNEKREEIKNKITAVKKERVQSLYGKMVVRIEALTERIEKLTLKIEERLQIISSSNEDINTTSIQKSLDQAKQILSDTKVQTAELDSGLKVMLSSENPGEVIKDIRISIISIKNNLKEVHSILVSVVGQIRGLRIGNSDEK